MSRLVESINILNGKMYNLTLHDARANTSRKALYGDQLPPINLAAAIHIPMEYCVGHVKCRVIYDEEIRAIEFQHYLIRHIRSVKVVHDNQISYDHKWEKRAGLDELFARREQADEILIFKDGWLADAYYYNLVILAEGQFLTPRIPLLPGVRRQQLLTNEWMMEADIDEELLRKASAVYLINALTPLGTIKLDKDQITF